MTMNSNRNKNILLSLLVVLLGAFVPSLSTAEESGYSLSGRLSARGVHALYSDGIEEQPTVDGRIKFDKEFSSLRIHSWLEGGWDGSVRRPIRDHQLFKDYDRVYQSNTPYLEFKELYLSYSTQNLDLRGGIQRFAWGRIDEYPANDLLNPWDYRQFPGKAARRQKDRRPVTFCHGQSGRLDARNRLGPGLRPLPACQA